MSMKRQSTRHQESLWIASDAVASSPGHPFYEELERVLQDAGFDKFVESKCASYYAKKQGRPSIPPGVYFRMLLIGYFERIDSERGICWRCSDSLSLRGFLSLRLDQSTPTHSALSRIRGRLPLAAYNRLRVIDASGFTTRFILSPASLCGSGNAAKDHLPPTTWRPRAASV